MTDDLETATALREALDEEVAAHQFAADSWPAIARRITTRPSWRMAAVRLAPAATALVIAVAVVLVLIFNRPGPSGSVGSSKVHHHPSAGSPWLKKDSVLSFAETGHGVLGLAPGYGAIWVGGLGVTYRVDPATDKVVDTIPTPRAGRFSRIATGLGAVWVSAGNTNGTDLGIYRINPRHDRVTAFIPLPGTGSPATLTAAFGSVWATSLMHYGSVFRIDPRTNQIVGQPIQVNASVPGIIVAGFGKIWVNAEGFNAPVTVINPTTG